MEPSRLFLIADARRARARNDAEDQPARDVPSLLTRAETEILQALADGMTPTQIAAARYISKRTVDFHLSNAYAKLGVRRAIGAINEARRRGWIL